MGGDREAQGQAQALYKLLIIQKAMNNGVWCDKDGLSYYPYWVLYSEKGMKRMSEEEEKQRKGIKQLFSCTDAYHTELAGVRILVVRLRIRFMVSPCALTTKKLPSTQQNNLKTYSFNTTELK